MTPLKPSDNDIDNLLNAIYFAQEDGFNEGLEFAAKATESMAYGTTIHSVPREKIPVLIAKKIRALKVRLKCD